MAVLFVRQLGIGLAVGLVVGVAAAWTLRRVTPGHRGPVPGGHARRRRAGLRRRRRPARVGLPRRLPRRAGARHGGHPGPADRDRPSIRASRGSAQVAMFVALGLLVFPSHLGRRGLRGTVLALVLVFVSRPVAVAVSTLPMRFTWRRARRPVGRRPARRRARGARHLPGHRGREREHAALRRRLLRRRCSRRSSRGRPSSRWPAGLGATTDEPALPRPLAEAGTIRRLGAEVLEYPVAEDDAVVGARVRDLGLPREAVVNVIVRGREAIPPRGSTVLRAGDRLHVLLRSELSRDVHTIVERWRKGPIGPPPRPPRRDGGAPADVHGRAARPGRAGGRRRAPARGGRRPRSSPSCACAATSRAASSPSRTGATRWSARSWRSAARAAAVELGDAPAAPPAGRRRRAGVAAERRRGRWRPTCRSRTVGSQRHSRRLRPRCASREDSTRPRRTARPCTTASSMAPWPASSRRPRGSSQPRPRRRRDPLRGRARRSSRQPAVLLPPADGGLHRAARRPALAAAELPARGARAVGARAAGRLPRVARRARLPRRAARPRGVRPAGLPQPRLRGVDGLRAEPERLERAYAEVESALYDGRTETVVIAPLLGSRSPRRRWRSARG